MRASGRPSAPQPRGFAILVIFAVIAAASVILGTQLTAAVHQEASALREKESLLARNAAERCMEIADSYVQAYGTTNALNDFDDILDPDGTAHNSDDFVPPSALLSGGALVTVPSGVSSTNNANKMFSYMHYAFDGAACLIRFDDNSDDASPNAVAGFTQDPTTEGPNMTGADVPWRDRDRSLIITAIGLYPANATVSSSYDLAHARATIRRIKSMPVNPTTGSAIQAGGSVALGGGNICGSQAGIVADSISGGACICGQVDAVLSGGATLGPCAACSPCGSSVGSDSTARDRGPPDVVVPTFTSFLENTGFGAPFSSGNNIAAGTYGAAVVYVRDAEATNPTTGASYGVVGVNNYMTANTVDVFAWDPEDDDTRVTLASGLVVPLGWPAGVVSDCRDTSALATLPRACKWTTDAAGSTTAVTCQSDESACWKLVARLDGTQRADIDGRVSKTLAEQSTAADAFATLSGNLPHFKNAKTWSSLASGSCTSCNTTGTAVFTWSTNTFTFANVSASDAANMVVVLDTVSSTTTVLNTTKDSHKLTLLSSTGINLTGSGVCCASCSCGVTCSSSTTGISKATNGPGFAIRTSGACSFPTASGEAVFGTAQCKNVDMPTSNGCFIGGIIANEAAPGTINCGVTGQTEAPWCNGLSATLGSSICVKNNADLVGDVLATGNICGVNSFGGNGTIQSESKIGAKNNTAFAGQLLAEKDVGFKNGANVTFNGTGGTTNNGLTANLWMESQW